MSDIDTLKAELAALRRYGDRMKIERDRYRNALEVAQAFLDKALEPVEQ